MNLIKKVFQNISIRLKDMPYLGYRLKYKLPRSFRFNGEGTDFHGDGQIIIGEKSYIGRFCKIQSVKGCKVIIGNGVSISHFVKIYTENSDPDQDFSKKGSKDFKKKRGNVIIEDFVWIGANVFIKEGVTIGSNSIVGANAVVTKDIPPYTIAGGIPARVIRKKNISDREDNL